MVLEFDVLTGEVVVDGEKLNRKKLIDFLKKASERIDKSTGECYCSDNLIYISLTEKIERSGIQMKADFSADTANNWVAMEFYKYISIEQLSLKKTKEEKKNFILKVCDAWLSSFAENYSAQWFSKRTTENGFVFQYFWGEIALISRIFPDGNSAAKVIVRLEENR